MSHGPRARVIPGMLAPRYDSYCGRGRTTRLTTLPAIAPNAAPPMMSRGRCAPTYMRPNSTIAPSATSPTDELGRLRTWADHAAEPDVSGRRVDGFRRAGGRSVAEAVVRGAQV
jgi:hypothetical protein